MISDLRAQAERFGSELLTDDVVGIDLSKRPFRVSTGEREFLAKTLIVATGARARQLGLDSELALLGKGVSYCATCDAAFFREAQTIIVGGGDSAMEEAIFLSKFAARVTVVHRREEFRASKIMLERARAQSNIEFLTPYRVRELVAGENGALGHAALVNIETGEEREIPVSGTFVAVGHEPQSALVHGQIDVDENGYVITEGSSTRTNRPGVFAAGDLVDHTYRQAITAAGSGCQAALDAERFLAAEEHERVATG